MAEDAAVGVENLALGYKSHVDALFHYRQIPCAGGIEKLHHGVHAVADFNLCRRRGHEGAHAHPAV